MDSTEPQSPTRTPPPRPEASADEPAGQAMDDALRGHRDLVARIMDVSPVGIVVVGRDGRIRFANARAAAILGVPADGLPHRPHDGPAWRVTALDGAPLPEAQHPFHRVMATGRALRDMRCAFHGPDGRRRLLAVNASPLADAAGQIDGVVAAFEDITDRAEIERALRQERDRAQSYLNLVRTVIVAIDTDHRVSLINRAGCELLGLPEHEILGADWFDGFVPPADRERTRHVFDQLITGRIEPVEYFENAVLTASGEQRIIAWHNALLHDAEGRIAGTLSSGNDITERQAAQDALAESEEKFRKAFHTSPDSMSITALDGTIVDANEGFEAFSGYRRDEVLGRSSLELGIWPSAEARADFVAALRRDGFVSNMEVPVRLPHGRRRIALLSASIIQLAGRPHILVNARDITELRQLLEQARQDAEIKQHLLGELNHRVKNNLATITSLMYIEKTRPTQSKQEFIDACLARLAGLSELHSLLSEQSTGVIDIEQLIRRVVSATLSATASPHPGLQFEADCPRTVVDIDFAGGIAMAVSELLTNAIRHGLPAAERPAVAVALRCVPDGIEVEVADNGAGLPEGFDLRRDAGTGLKLVSYIADKQLRGTLQFRRDAGRTIATIRFPISAPRK